jgi:hypothetical protein
MTEARSAHRNRASVAPTVARIYPSGWPRPPVLHRALILMSQRLHSLASLGGSRSSAPMWACPEGITTYRE